MCYFSGVSAPSGLQCSHLSNHWVDNEPFQLCLAICPLIYLCKYTLPSRTRVFVPWSSHWTATEMEGPGEGEAPAILPWLSLENSQLLLFLEKVALCQEERRNSANGKCMWAVGKAGGYLHAWVNQKIMTYAVGSVSLRTGQGSKRFHCHCGQVLGSKGMTSSCCYCSFNK